LHASGKPILNPPIEASGMVPSAQHLLRCIARDAFAHARIDLDALGPFEQRLQCSAEPIQ
jgi:hypothetical protein